MATWVLLPKTSIGIEVVNRNVTSELDFVSL